jgi:hypothetical protein
MNRKDFEGQVLGRLAGSGREGSMAKDKGAKKETKSDFLRKVLSKKPELDHRQVNRLWQKAGHPGEISTALFYQVRSKMGIKIEWGWVRVSEAEAKATSRRPRAAGARPIKPQGLEATGNVYQFKITLQDIQPPVWRRIQVQDCTLDKLHEHIQTAMGWTNSHLHHFRINDKLYGDPMLMAETFEELNYADSTTTRLGDILPRNGERFGFAYEYDFGDSWEHEVLFEGSLPAEPGRRYPLCVEGERACPPEDVGGSWGYMDFLEAISDPEHEQHDDMLNWIGRKFKPEAFNPVIATREMKRGLPDWRNMR